MFWHIHSVCGSQARFTVNSGTLTTAGFSVSIGFSVGPHCPPSWQIMKFDPGRQSGSVPVRHMPLWHIPTVQSRWQAVVSGLLGHSVMSTGTAGCTKAASVVSTALHIPSPWQSASYGNSSQRCRDVARQSVERHTPRLQPETQSFMSPLHFFVGPPGVVTSAAAVTTDVVVNVAVVTVVVCAMQDGSPSVSAAQSPSTSLPFSVYL